MIRPDAETNYGGDTAQMHHTASHLRALGVDAQTCIGPPTDDQIALADVVHLFNLQTPTFTLAQLKRARGKKTALSTIWWDFAADEVFRTSRKWALVRSVIGTRTARPILEAKMRGVLHEARSEHREILKTVDLLLPNAVSEAEQLRRLTDFSATVHVVPNAVEIGGPEDDGAASQLIDRHRIPREFVLIASRVEPIKNQLEYIRAIQGMDLTTVLAGSAQGDYADQCCREGAVAVGRLDAPTLRSLYRRATLHALPSLRETPGLASLEAAALGCRIVSTEIGSAREYFKDMAEYCDPHSARSMLNATKRALAKPADPRLPEHIATNYTWRHAAVATLAAYQEVLHR